MISTPHNAYLYLRDLGLSHEVSVKLTESRQVFEYFLACVEAAS